MPDFLFGFRQVVSAGGYSWFERPLPPPPPALRSSTSANSPADSLAVEAVLTDGRPLGTPPQLGDAWFNPLVPKPGERRRGKGRGGSSTETPPFDPTLPVLFRAFADLEPSRDAIRAFADRFGRLFAPTEGVTIHRPIPGATWTVPVPGDPEYIWHGEIAAMRQAIDRWNVVREDAEALALPVEAPEFREARHALARLVNQHLEGRVTTRVVTDPADARLLVRITPINLLGALWLQCALWIEGGAEPRRCAACTRWFAVGAGGARTDRQTCNDACRQRKAAANPDRPRRAHQEQPEAPPQRSPQPRRTRAHIGVHRRTL